MDMLKMAKEAMAMRARLTEMDKALKDQKVEEAWDGVTVRMNGKGELQGITIAPETVARGAAAVEKAVTKAFMAAMEKTRQIMADESKKITGGIKIPGLF